MTGVFAWLFPAFFFMAIIVYWLSEHNGGWSFGNLKKFSVDPDLSVSRKHRGYCPCNKGKSRRNSPLKGFHYQISQNIFALHFASQAVKFSLPQIFLKLMRESQGNSKNLKLTSPRGLKYPSWPFISIWFCFQEGYRQKKSSFVQRDW